MITDADIEQALLDIGADWGPVEWLAAEGAMAAVGLAVHCRATSPDLSVHVKIYLHAESHGPSDYLRQGSAERIGRLFERFEELKDDDGIATVRIHGLHKSDDGLIVIMDRVTLIESLFDKDPDGLRADTPRALRELDTHQMWLHFDVCPKNVGRTQGGDFCYVDLESIYRVGERKVVVSEPLTKEHRIPSQLVAELVADLGSGDGLSRELAERFQNHQLARLAMDMCAGNELVGSDVESFLVNGKLDHADMWDKEFVQLVKRSQAPDPQLLAIAIEQCGGAS